MMRADMFESWDVFLTISAEGVIRYWRVLDDGSITEYEAWPKDARG